MTSNTTPSGECISSSVAESNYQPYKCFTGRYSTSDDGQYWQSLPSTNPWIGYDFENPVNIKKVIHRRTYAPGGDNARDMIKAKIQASNDKTNWVDIGNEYNVNDSEPNALTEVVVLSQNTYRYWRIYQVSGSTIGTKLTQLQFYGRSQN